MLFLLSLFLNSAGLYYAFGVEPAVYLGILFFAMLFAPLDFILSIVVNMISRRNEYAADKYAIMTIPEPASFVSTLKKLASANLINITPHPLDVFLNYSHPPLMDRIQAVELSMMKRAAS